MPKVVKPKAVKPKTMKPKVKKYASYEVNEKRTRRRFFQKVVKHKRGCWEWTGARFQNGMGQFRFQGKHAHAHRVSFFYHYGYFPERVYRTCGNKDCVNPRHLEESK